MKIEIEFFSKVTVWEKNKAIVGGSAYSHQSGIHQDGLLKKRETYEIISPEQALKITNKSDIKGFYKAGVVYFVEGKFNSETVFHEFKSVNFFRVIDSTTKVIPEWRNINNLKQITYDDMWSNLGSNET